jgi:hypothetical protein
MMAAATEKCTSPEAEAVFRWRRANRNIGLVLVPVFAAGAVFGTYIALTEPKVPNRIALFGLIAGVPLVMEGLAIWTLAVYWRAELTIRGDRITLRGVVGQREIDLPDVIKARWWEGAVIRLRTDRTRLAIVFDNFELEDRRRIVDRLRRRLRPDVQTGWNHFAYKLARRERRPGASKLGPNEIVLRPNDWDWYLVPFVVMPGLAAMVAWWSTGVRLFLVVPLLPPVALTMIRAATPAEGMIVAKLSLRSGPHAEGARFVWFLLLWALVGGLGVVAYEVFQSRMAHVEAVFIVGVLLWLGILLVEGGLEDRRWSRREHAAAELAAMARGEAGTDPWRILA